jgi:hypothetical protein
MSRPRQRFCPHGHDHRNRDCKRGIQLRKLFAAHPFVTALGWQVMLNEFNRGKSETRELKTR